MTIKKQIKIIKQAERNDSQSDKESTSVRKEIAEKRNAGTIVAEWISELRRKKAEETAQGFQSLFGKAA